MWIHRLCRWVPVMMIVLGGASAACADVVELIDGTRIETATVRFADDLVTLADGRTIPRNEIRQILMGPLKSTAGEDAAAGLMDVAALRTQAAEAQQQYPDVGAIHLVDLGTWTLRPDGTQLQREHAASLILKEPFKELGRISRSYEEGRSRVRLVAARTITADGEVHVFDPAALKEAKPSAGKLFYTKYKTVTGQLPQVETGAIVETIWETETYNPYDPLLFFPRHFFGSTEPVLWSRATVRVPSDRDLFYETHNFPNSRSAAPLERTEDGYHVYEWELHDVEHVVAEPVMPPVGQVVPYVACSPFDDWEYIFDFLGKFQREHTQVTPAVEEQVREIVGDATDPEEQLRRIYHWLQREVRYVSIKGSMGSGWSGHPAELTLKNKYGDCIDKATLFATMLKAVDIDAEPVIIATYGMPEDPRTLPTMWGNHAITEVHLDGRDFHLDCTGTSFRYPYFVLLDHGRTTINVLERKIGRVEVPPPQENALDVNVRMRLDEDGTLKAIFELKPNGSFEGVARQALDEINAMLRKMVVEQLVNMLSPGAELKGLDISDESVLEEPLTVKFRILLPEYPTQAGDLMIFEMPLARLVKMTAALTALDEREYDIELPSAFSLRQKIRLELPEGYVPKGLPAPVQHATPYVTYDARYGFEDGTIVFEDTFSVHRREIPTEDYREVQRFMEDFTDFVKLPLFLSKTRS